MLNIQVIVENRLANKVFLISNQAEVTPLLRKRVLLLCLRNIRFPPSYKLLGISLTNENREDNHLLVCH
jgi:hypothetical protein